MQRCGSFSPLPRRWLNRLFAEFNITQQAPCVFSLGFLWDVMHISCDRGYRTCRASRLALSKLVEIYIKCSRDGKSVFFCFPSISSIPLLLLFSCSSSFPLLFNATTHLCPSSHPLFHLCLAFFHPTGEKLLFQPSYLSRCKPEAPIRVYRWLCSCAVHEQADSL